MGLRRGRQPLRGLQAPPGCDLGSPMAQASCSPAAVAQHMVNPSWQGWRDPKKAPSGLHLPPLCSGKVLALLPELGLRSPPPCPFQFMI